jgi:hypothetical protein
MPDKATVFRWLRTNEAFCDQYTRAKEESADALTDEMLEIADDSTRDSIKTEAGEVCNTEYVQRSRLRVETRKWIASKLKPKKYGEKVSTEHTGPNGGAFQHVHRIELVALK